DPLVADLQIEYAESIRRGRVWRSRWALLSGHVAFLKTIALCGLEGAICSLGGGTVDDRLAMGRTLRCSAAAMAVTTVVLELLSSWPRETHHPMLFVYV